MITVTLFADKCGGRWAALLDAQDSTKLNVLELGAFG
jgi:hypothetical protein